MEHVTITFVLTCLLGAIVYVVALLRAHSNCDTAKVRYEMQCVAVPDVYRYDASLVVWLRPGVVDCVATDTAIMLDFLSRHSTWPIVGASK
jgi:hypothetical protein